MLHRKVLNSVKTFRRLTLKFSAFILVDPVINVGTTAKSAQLPTAALERSTPLHPGVDRPLQRVRPIKLFYFRFQFFPEGNNV